MNYYDTIAPGYEELHEKEQLEKLNIIAEHIKPKPAPTDKLLDVGCGSGVSTRFWKCDRTGIDPSQELLKVAKQKDPEGNYVLAPAEKIPLPDNSFDIVISITAIHNFSDPEQGLKEIKRVGKKDFAFSVLKKAKNYAQIENWIEQMFKVVKKTEHSKDTIFICQKV